MRLRVSGECWEVQADPFGCYFACACYKIHSLTLGNPTFQNELCPNPNKKGPGKSRGLHDFCYDVNLENHRELQGSAVVDAV